MKFEYPPGATPINQDELFELIPSFITTQDELNALEQMNIAKAQAWLANKKLSPNTILDELFFREVHMKMFKDVWKWAGKYRNTDKNIGIDWMQITTFLRQLIDDIKYQIEHNTYSKEEAITRFHHRLVWIHPFPNGNGRHARILTDLLFKKLSNKTLHWGGINIKNYSSASQIRKKYIEALRIADKGNYEPLIYFINNK